MRQTKGCWSFFQTEKEDLHQIAFQVMAFHKIKAAKILSAGGKAELITSRIHCFRGKIWFLEIFQNVPFSLLISFTNIVLTFLFSSSSDGLPNKLRQRALPLLTL